MAVQANFLTDGNNQNANSFATASIAPVANRLVVLVVGTTRSGGSLNPTVTGAGMTWVRQFTQISASDGDIRIHFFLALSASPGSGALTIDCGGQTQTDCRWTITEFYGNDSTNTAGVQYAGNDSISAGTGLTVTMGAFSSSVNATHGVIYDKGSKAITKGGNFVELSNASSVSTVESEWAPNNQTSVNWTWASSSEHVVAAAVEIAGLPGHVLTPSSKYW